MDIDINPELKKDLEVIETLTKLLKSLGYKAIVGGGWIRDVLNGVEPRDIDIFLLNESSEEAIDEELIKGLHRFGTSTKTIRKYGNCKMREDVNFVIKCSEFNADIISVKGDIYETISSFDTSICQVFGYVVCGKLYVFSSDDYQCWKSDNVVLRYEDLDTRDDHLDRLSRKYKFDGFREVSSREDIGFHFEGSAILNPKKEFGIKNGAGII